MKGFQEFALFIFVLKMTGNVGDTATLSAGGRIEFEFRSAVMLNILRVYTAAGPQAFYGLKGPGKDEFDMGSLHFDIGTSGGTVDNGGNGKRK